MKRCPACTLEKPLEDFARNKGKPDGRTCYCRACVKLKREKNRDTYRAAVNAARNTPDGKRALFAENIRKLYGIGVEDYARMLLAQDRRCALCRREFTEKGRTRPNVDHCHTTKLVRGLLCYDCNWGLGAFHDDPAALLRAANYLERSSASRA